MLIPLVFWFTLKWLGPQSVRRWWTFGLFWLALTLAFEIGLGRATGMSWDQIASDFDPRRGGLLAFGMLAILVAPRLLAQRRGLIHDGHRLQNVSTTRGASRGFGWTALKDTKRRTGL